MRPVTCKFLMIFVDLTAQECANISRSINKPIPVKQLLMVLEMAKV